MVRKTDKPRLLVTVGEPAGIGPDIIVKLSQTEQNYDITVITDPELLMDRSELLQLPVRLLASDSNTPAGKHEIKILPVKLSSPSVPGKLNVDNAKFVLNILEKACDLCLSGEYDAIITAPIQKSVINDSGIKFSGHTEYFAQRCQNRIPVMLLSCPQLKVALVTTHLPLVDVPKNITREKLMYVIRTLIDEFPTRFGIKKPNIVVCGLNPHAGEEGHLGREEIEIINPVIESFRSDGHNITGTVPADTAFRDEIRESADVFVCMYHDQGLPVLKTVGFGEAVNITLGLPIIRTSVDHGTALSLAGTGKANHQSLLAAIEAANLMVLNQNRINTLSSE